MSLPEAFLKRMEILLGEAYPAFFESYRESRAVGLRANPLKISAAELKALVPFPLEPVPWAEEGFTYREEDRPGRHPFHDAGLYYIQEPSAMSAAAALCPRPGERVLDLCAAPGGKATQLAGRMRGKGLLAANEFVPGRAKILAQNLERLGVSNAIVLNEDSARLAERLPGFFDRILVDAPCSGEGMFRKDPAACGEWSEENVRMCAARQLEILHNAVRMLKPRGRLVYSTCTFSPEENEGTVAAVLRAEPSLSIADTGLSSFFSPGERGWTPDPPAELEKTLRIWPHLVRGEGHFVAAFQKEDTGLSAPPRPFTAFADQKLLQPYMDFCRDCLTLRPDEGKNLCLFGNELYCLPADAFALDGLKVVRPGLHLGTLKKNRFEPAHALCMALPAGAFRRSVALSACSAETAAFLRGETLRDEKGLSGWLGVLVEGFPIGWGKASGGMVKNHYPKGLRRMG